MSHHVTHFAWKLQHFFFVSHFSFTEHFRHIFILKHLFTALLYHVIHFTFNKCPSTLPLCHTLCFLHFSFVSHIWLLPEEYEFQTTDIPLLVESTVTKGAHVPLPTSPPRPGWGGWHPFSLPSWPIHYPPLLISAFKSPHMYWLNTSKRHRGSPDIT